MAESPGDLRSCLGAGREFHPSKDSVFKISPEPEFLSFWSVSFVSLIPGLLIPTDQKNIYFHAVTSDARMPLELSLPLVAKFNVAPYMSAYMLGYSKMLMQDDASMARACCTPSNIG